jgi:hypothetical protein
MASQPIEVVHVEISPTMLVVFIDDTGNQSLPEQDPIYGLGGCAILGRDYIQQIYDPWREVRRKVTGCPDTPLHAADFSKFARENSQCYEVVNEFFQGSFYRFGASYTKKTEFLDGISNWHAMHLVIKARILDIIENIFCDHILLIFESSEKDNKNIATAFENIMISKDNSEIKISLYFMDKSKNEPGLEVADFVVNPIYSYIKKSLNNHNSESPDFNAVFRSVDREYVSFIDVTSISFARD